ncbi:hypothetical protein BSL78_25320 [Apostichopus japonicus]|uniref:Uncharacterized protein n=1 Tax=Stichopus japonicus TaxID=307972 RepID=A0A2G8JPZ1_STIJA|nr:hypothetical protein BSL78_25320 [Apostichopus japonicus]
MANMLLKVFVFLLAVVYPSNALRCEESYIQTCRPFANASEVVCQGWDSNNMLPRVTTCSDEENVCTTNNSTFSLNMLEFDVVITGCGTDFPIGCHDEDAMADGIPGFGDQMAAYQQAGLTMKSIIICACAGDLCNSGISSIVDSSLVMIAAVVVSLNAAYPWLNLV